GTGGGTGCQGADSAAGTGCQGAGELIMGGGGADGGNVVDGCGPVECCGCGPVEYLGCGPVEYLGCGPVECCGCGPVGGGSAVAWSAKDGDAGATGGCIGNVVGGWRARVGATAAISASGPAAGGGGALPVCCST